jgi:hypothetical protein
MSFQARQHFVAACIASLGFWAPAARALVIEAHTQGQAGANAQHDDKGPAGSGSLLASSLFAGPSVIGGGGPAEAHAAQNDQGVAGVRVDGACTGPGRLSLQSSTRWHGSAVNQGDHPIEYLYQFHITAPRLTLYELNPLGAAASTVTWTIDVHFGNRSLFAASATLTGGSHSFLLQKTGTDLNGRFFSNPATHTFGYGFSGFDGLVSLGMFDPGHGPDVDTILSVSLLCNETGDGARGEIGDPLDLGGDPGLNSVIIETDAVSVAPATWSAIKGFYR